MGPRVVDRAVAQRTRSALRLALPFEVLADQLERVPVLPVDPPAPLPGSLPGPRRIICRCRSHGVAIGLWRVIPPRVAHPIIRWRQHFDLWWRQHCHGIECVWRCPTVLALAFLGNAERPGSLRPVHVEFTEPAPTRVDVPRLPGLIDDHPHRLNRLLIIDIVQRQRIADGRSRRRHQHPVHPHPRQPQLAGDLPNRQTLRPQCPYLLLHPTIIRHSRALEGWRQRVLQRRSKTWSGCHWPS